MRADRASVSIVITYDRAVVDTWKASFIRFLADEAVVAIFSGVCHSYSNRYFLLKYFNIATPDADPDSFRKKQKEAELEADRLVAEQIIQRFDETLKAYLGDHSGKTEDVKKFVSKYAKGGNYFAITESALAGKLFSDFKTTFQIKE